MLTVCPKHVQHLSFPRFQLTSGESSEQNLLQTFWESKNLTLRAQFGSAAWWGMAGTRCTDGEAELLTPLICSVRARRCSPVIPVPPFCLSRPQYLSDCALSHPCCFSSTTSTADNKNPKSCLPAPSAASSWCLPAPAPFTRVGTGWHSSPSSLSCAIRALGMPPPTPPWLPGKLVPVPVAGGGARRLRSYLSAEPGVRGELEIALADTDTCAEQQGPALAVVIAHCMAMSQPEPRTRLPCLPHRALPGNGCSPHPLQGGPPKHRSEERMAMRASCSFLSSRDAFKCQGGCASCDLLHYFCCYPCTGSSCVREGGLQHPNAACSWGDEPHRSPRKDRGPPWDRPSALPRVSGMSPLDLSHG